MEAGRGRLPNIPFARPLAAADGVTNLPEPCMAVLQFRNEVAPILGLGAEAASGITGCPQLMIQDGAM
jgi:hypothetical protein